MWGIKSSRHSHARTPIITTEFINLWVTLDYRRNSQPWFPSLSSALVAVEWSHLKCDCRRNCLREAIIISSSCPNFQIVGLDPPLLLKWQRQDLVFLSPLIVRCMQSNFPLSSSPVGSATSEFSCALNVRRGSCVFERCQFESASGFGIACLRWNIPLFQNCKISRSPRGVLFTEEARCSHQMHHWELLRHRDFA